MAPTSPTSAPAKPALQSPAAGLTTASVRLPLRFMLTGMASLVAGVVWLLLCPDILSAYHYGPHILAVTHLFTLGWITTIIMGALYQLAPVALETKLYSERLAKWQHVLHVIGVLGMVWMFWIGDMKQVGHFGSLVGTGMVLFAFNVAKTLARIPRWNLVASAIAAAMFWLILTMLAGLYVAASKCWNFSPFAPFAQMHAHAHLGGLGFFTMLIVGVSYKLVPMFLLSELQNPRRAAGSIILLNVGLAGVFVSILLTSQWKLLFAYVVVGALCAYGLEMLAIWRARKRRTADWGLRYFFTSLWLMLPLAVLGLVLSQPGLPLTHIIGQTENLYGFLGLIGLVTLGILGMLYKIIPFLVWYASYSSHVGRAKVPAMHELYSARLQAAGYVTFLGGLLGTGTAVLLGHADAVRWTWSLLALSLVIFFINMGKILSHFWRPQYTALNLDHLLRRATANARPATPTPAAL